MTGGCIVLRPVVDRVGIELQGPVKARELRVEPGEARSPVRHWHAFQNEERQNRSNFAVWLFLMNPL